MIDPASRYAEAPQQEREDTQGRKIRHIVPPILPHPDDQPGMRQTVSDTDRPDTLAARVYGRPTAWWMIANANAVAHPDQLTEKPGEEITVPMPGGVGGPMR